MTYAIETIGLGKRFPVPKRYRDILLRPFHREECTALEEVSLQLRRGQLAGLLGRNGAGKTTLIKILGTLVLPTSGRALVDGHDVALDGRAVRRSIGFVVNEERSFYWRLTGRQNLAFFATLNDLSGAERDARTRKAIDLVGLERHADRMFKDYSSGMRQRLSIARGLLTDPGILFLDEPTKTLDPLIARDLRNLVKDVLVGEQGRSVIFATNNLREADHLFDSVSILENGRILAHGTRREIGALLDAGDHHVLRVRDPSGRIDAILASIRAAGHQTHVKSDSLEDGLREVEIHSPSGTGRISDVIEKLVGERIEVESCSALEPSLEDIFARLVERPGQDVD